MNNYISIIIRIAYGIIGLTCANGGSTKDNNNTTEYQIKYLDNILR